MFIHVATLIHSYLDLLAERNPEITEKRVPVGPERLITKQALKFEFFAIAGHIAHYVTEVKHHGAKTNKLHLIFFFTETIDLDSLELRITKLVQADCHNLF